MPEQFVPLADHVQAITRVEDKIEMVQGDLEEIKSSIKELRTVIIESNGHGKSLITQTRENTEEVSRLKQIVSEFKNETLKRKAKIYDLVWKYTIRFAVIFFFTALGMLFLRDPKVIVEVLKLTFHVK